MSKNASTLTILLATIAGFIEANIHRPNGPQAKEALDELKNNTVPLPEDVVKVVVTEPSDVPGQLPILFDGEALVNIPVTEESRTARRDAETNPRGIEDSPSSESH
jgi:hypothetical protein